ncbi:hypothetical protein FRC98_08420 [Lujinxingia vulgaris]|uniref:PEGA domain-containing protein n=1 Tax=Lujinxingia vulgaris TaxID=2600176 RepID=A0A5C6XHV5_9DELT|nr:hypothetical protein [Lujinxingia vulgaris]TXD37702.1 hypothetical protein FRC98_08420 [Lujinxingia vulgaris]
MKRWFSGIFAMMMCSALPQAYAQDAPDAPAEVVVLRFANSEVDQAVMDRFYTELHDALEATEEMTLAPGGEVTIDDLVMMGGCSTPDAACLAGLQDFVAGERLVYGSIQRSEDVHMFSMYLFDFKTGEFLQRIEEKTLRGDDAWVARGLPAVVEHFVWGESAEVQVEVGGGADVEVRLDGEAVGQGSQTLKDVAPGEAVISARSEDGEQLIERVILRRGENPAVYFTFENAIDEAPAVASSGSLLPGVGLAALGVAGVVVGVVGQSQLGGLEADAEALVAGRSAISPGQVSRAEELQSQMDRAHTMRVIGFSAGGLALAAGGYLIVRALGAADDERDGLSWDVGVNADSVGASVRLDF